MHYLGQTISEDDLTKGEYVDLYLPSGLKWATCNLGAAMPCDYGDYYMWGSVTPNTNDTCNWANAPFNNGSSSYNSEYFESVKDTVCPNGILASEYDAAYQATGGEARMPTYEEFQELLGRTNNEWVTCTYLGADHATHSVMGRKFTSKEDSSKCIFIPASGGRNGSSFLDQGGSGCVWSSSLDAASPNYARYLLFYSSICLLPSNNRYFGFGVRPVCS